MGNCNWGIVLCLIVANLLFVYCEQDNIEAYGGEMRLQGRVEDVSEQDFKRSVAILLDCDISDIYVLGIFQGVRVDFQIADPSLEEIRSPSATEITKLKGDDKMTLLLHWWLTDDPRFYKFPYSVIDFIVYGEAEDGGAYVVGDTSVSYRDFRPSFLSKPSDGGHDNHVQYIEVDAAHVLSVNSLVMGLLCFICLLLFI